MKQLWYFVEYCVLKAGQVVIVKFTKRLKAYQPNIYDREYDLSEIAPF